MKSFLVPLAVCCVLVTLAAADTLSVEMPERPRLQVHATEFGVGLGVFAVAAPIGVAISYGAVAATVWCMVGSLFMEAKGLDGALLFAAGMVVAPFAATVAVVPGLCAEAVFRVGERLTRGGQRLPAFVGAYVGVVPCAGIALGGRALAQAKRDDWLGLPFYILAAACVPLGATVGYNLSVRRESGHGFLDNRAAPPSLTFTRTELPDRTVAYGVKLQLAGLRF
jgi:hypothetical protein